jgi:pimeloyl-ACP methyl ester carboxylesterase
MKLILMPGMDGTGDLFQPLVAVMPGIETTVLRYPLEQPLGYSELLPLVRACLPQAEPFVLLGESFSGPLALMLAAEAPPGLRGLVLCASFAEKPVWWVPGFARHFAIPLFFRAMPTFARIKALAGGYATPQLQTLLGKAHSSVSPAVMAARARAILAVNVVAHLQACTVPLLYLRGERDRVVGPGVLRSLLRHKPSMQVVTVPAPHLVLQVAPEASAHAIRTFMSASCGAV